MAENNVPRIPLEQEARADMYRDIVNDPSLPGGIGARPAIVVGSPEVGMPLSVAERRELCAVSDEEMRRSGEEIFRIIREKGILG